MKPIITWVVVFFISMLAPLLAFANSEVDAQARDVPALLAKLRSYPDRASPTAVIRVRLAKLIALRPTKALFFFKVARSKISDHIPSDERLSLAAFQTIERSKLPEKRKQKLLKKILGVINRGFPGGKPPQ